MSSRAGAADVNLSVRDLAIWGSVCVAGVILVTTQLGTPWWAVAGMVAGLVLLPILLHPAWLLLALVVVEASNASGVLGTAGGVSLYITLLAAATAALVLNLVLGRVRIRYSPVILLMAIFIAAQVPSVVTAQDSTSALALLVGFGKDLWFLVVVIVLAASLSNAWALARAVVAPVSAIAAMSLINEFALGNTASFAGFSVVTDATGVGVATARHAGSFVDANFWGRVLLLAVPLCMALVADAMQRGRRVPTALWALCAVFLLGATYLTQSRGALLGLAVGLAMWLAVTSTATRKLLKYLPLLAAAAVLAPGVGSRLATLGEVDEASVGVGDYSLVERTATQQITMAMFTHNPIAGVGLGNIPASWDEYDHYSDVTVRRQVAPHNLYLQVAAEGGVFGLAGWLIMYVGIIILAVRLLLSSPERPGEPVSRERLLASAAAASLAAWGTTSIFLHLSYLRPLLLVFTIVAVLDLQTPRSTIVRTPSGSSWRQEKRRAMASGLLLLITGAVVLDAASHYTWRTRTTVTVLPTPSRATEAAEPYDFDVLTRSSIMPTYAAVIGRTGAEAIRQEAVNAGSEPADYRVSAVGIPSAALVRLDVWGPDRATTEAAAQRAARAGVAFVNADPALGSLAQASVDSSYVALVRQWSLGRAGVVVLAAAGAYLVARRLVRHRGQQAR